MHFAEGKKPESYFILLYTDFKEQVCSKNNELLAVSMRPYYLPREFTQVCVRSVYSMYIFSVYCTPMQLVMFSTQSKSHCRYSTHRPSSRSLEISIMPLCPPPCLHSHSMSLATPESIKYWTYFVPTEGGIQPIPAPSLVHLLPV